MKNSHHSTTLVVDFDDTIALTNNRDWANAKPNAPLIQKLNLLFDEGWTILIVTARGNISCGGDHDAADRKYREQIERWLTTHGVKYDLLSFQKKLAAYYIDDKAMTPETFVERFSVVNLKGGISGAKVVYDSAVNSVYKTAKNTRDVVLWYNKAAELDLPIPKIYHVVDDTIKMEFLPDYTGTLESILDLSFRMSTIKPLHPGILPIKYVDRCLNRVKDDFSSEIDIKLLSSVIEYAVAMTPRSFSHGDLSMSNVMGSTSDPTLPSLIDPIDDPTLLSSWVIDIAKLYTSINLDAPNEFGASLQILDFAESKGIKADVILAHELGHLCRIYPYATGVMKKFIFSSVKEKLNVFRQENNS